MSCSCMPFAIAPARLECYARTMFCAMTNEVLDVLLDIAGLMHYVVLLHGKYLRPIWSEVTLACTRNSAEGCRMDGGHTAIGCSLLV